MNIQQYADLKIVIQGRLEYSEFSPYMGRSEFDTHMDLESSDAILLKYLIQTMFEGIEFTINPHFMPINLEPFIIFASIPMN